MLPSLSVSHRDGCADGGWFYPLLPPFPRGTGVFVNTGKSLVLADRDEASRYFRNNTPSGAAWCKDDERNACYTAKGGRLFCTDRCWAARAHAVGYDSVQILRGPDFMPELIVSTRACLSQKAPIGTCPPAGVPLRTGEAASRECRCSETRAVLNCLDTQLE